jgi:hypothetical protein
MYTAFEIYLSPAGLMLVIILVLRSALCNSVKKKREIT